MTEALLAAVLARPADDAPRLVLADALASAGDPRGELILVQCRLTSRTLSPSLRAELRRRERALVPAVTAALGAQVLGVGWKLRRGFVDEIWGETAAVTERAALFRSEPIARLTVTDVDAERMEVLAASGVLLNVDRLKLQGTLEGDGVRLLTAALRERTRPLVSLNVAGTGIDALGAKTLAAALTGCRTLVLTSNAIGDEGLAAIASSKPLASIEALYVADSELSDEGLEAFARLSCQSGLTRLGVARNEEVTEEGVRAIARSKKLRRLRWVELTDPDEGHQRVLSRARQL